VAAFEGKTAARWPGGLRSRDRNEEAAKQKGYTQKTWPPCHRKRPDALRKGRLVELGLSPGRAGAKGEEMTSGKLRELNERIAELFREGSPISTPSEPPLATSVDPPIIDEARAGRINEF